MLKKHAGYQYKDIMVRKVAENLIVPILDIHGTGDTKIQLYHQGMIMKNVKSYHETMQVEGAEHGQSVNVDPVGYRKKVKEFIDKVHKLDTERK